jgi:hypothetical protein
MLLMGMVFEEVNETVVKNCGNKISYDFLSTKKIGSNLKFMCQRLEIGTYQQKSLSRVMTKPT